MTAFFDSEPSPRWGHCSAVVDGELYIYGGVTEEVYRKEEIHVFNQHRETWQTRTATGESPLGLIYSACASLGRYIYHYGGFDEFGYLNTLHQLDTDSLQWSQLPSGPRKKDGRSMISYQDKLVLFGGYGSPTPSSQLGDEFIEDDGFDGGWTNELHLFNTQECE